MKILLDTEIIMDILCDSPNREESLLLIKTALEKKRVELIVPPTAIHDIAKKGMETFKNPIKVYEIFDHLRMIFTFYGMNDHEIEDAIREEISNRKVNYLSGTFHPNKFDYVVSRDARAHASDIAYVLPPSQATWKIIQESRLWNA